MARLRLHIIYVNNQITKYQERPQTTYGRSFFIQIRYNDCVRVSEQRRNMPDTEKNERINIMNKANRDELLGQLMDQIEDHIDEHIGCPNENPILSDESYDSLKEKLESTLKNWGLLPEKNIQDVIFLLLGSEDSGIDELITTLKKNDWNVITENSTDNYDDIQAIYATPKHYFETMKDLEEKGFLIETIFCVPEHGMDENNRFIWSSEEDKNAFEPILENLTDTEGKAYDFLRIRAINEDLGKNRTENIAEYMQHTQNIYRNFNKILDRMLDNGLIFTTNDNRNHIKIRRENDPNAYIHRQALISNLVRESDEMAGELMQLILYYLSNCEL